MYKIIGEQGIVILSILYNTYKTLNDYYGTVNSGGE